MDGILLVNKPIGLSSYGVVSKIKHIYNTSKVGHCGTLDPFADGLLIVTLNNATKLSRFIEAKEKEYVAVLKLGERTETGDNEGQIVEIAKIPDLNEDLIKETLKSFLGDLKQLPPMYSAIKINGETLYKLARQGKEVKREYRDIHISEIELISFKDNLITFRVKCSKGTYIRVLGEDIAVKLNCVGHLINLTRTSIGSFSLKDAINLDDLKSDTPLLSIEEALSILPSITLDNVKARLAKYGQPLEIDSKEDIIVLLNENKKAIAIYQKDKDKYRCLRGI